jgi:hypothetical protein
MFASEVLAEESGIIAGDRTQTPFPRGAHQRPEEGFVFRFTQSVAAQQHRHYLPGEIMRNSEAPAIGPAFEREINFFQARPWEEITFCVPQGQLLFSLRSGGEHG